MKRLVVTAILFLLIGTGIGFLWGHFQTAYPPTFVTKGPMTVLSATASGTLPSATRIYYHSSGHGSVVFRVYVRVDEDQISRSLTPIATDYEYGYRALKAD